MAFTEAGPYSPYELLDKKSEGADPDRPKLFDVPAGKPVQDGWHTKSISMLRRYRPDELSR